MFHLVTDTSANLPAEFVREEFPARKLLLRDTYGASLLRHSAHPPKQILTVDYEPMTGSHVGPGALALFFLSEPRAKAL